jgi:hypothetical protein
MARKLPVIQRVVGEDALFAAIYGTISSSLYFALGVVALYALGLTPIVLPVVGLLVLLAAGAYAEGASATGGGSPLIVRRAFGDLAGFIVGWAILLDLLVVTLLSALFVPRYAEAAVGNIGQMSGRSAELIGVGVIAVLGLGRILPQASRVDLVRPLALVDMLAQLTLAILGLTAMGHIDVLTSSVDLGTAPTWTSLGYALPIALVAFTGVEIVAGLLQEAANPARPLRRITIGAIAATVLAYAVIAAAALSLLPVHRAAGTPSGYASDLSTVWATAPLAGAAQAIGAQGRHCARCARCLRWARCLRRSCAARGGARPSPGRWRCSSCSAARSCWPCRCSERRSTRWRRSTPSASCSRSCSCSRRSSPCACASRRYRVSCAWAAACTSAAATSRCSRCSGWRCRGGSGCSTWARIAPGASCRPPGWPAACCCS